MEHRFKCAKCEYKTSKKSNYDRHMKSHAKNETNVHVDDLTCPRCHTAFSTKYSCKRHFQTVCSNAAPNHTTLAPNHTTLAPNHTTLAPNHTTLAPNHTTLAPNHTTLAPKINTDCTGEIKCSKCQKEFAKQWNLTRHIKICKGVTGFTCRYCRKTLATQPSKSRHEHTCEINPANMEVVAEPQTQAIAPTIQIQNHNNTNTQNNIGTQIINNITIEVNDLGNEDLSHVTSELLDQRLRQFHGKGIINLIRDVHFNNDVPQNHNIRVNSRKNQTLKVKEKGAWQVRASSDIYEWLVTLYKDKLFDRLYSPEFQQQLQQESDFGQLRNNLLQFDRKADNYAYFTTKQKFDALVENMDQQTTPSIMCSI
jgi:Zinc finger, C2H2 type